MVEVHGERMGHKGVEACHRIHGTGIFTCIFTIENQPKVDKHILQLDPSSGSKLLQKSPRFF